jgi:hypothetical protein
LKPLPEEKPERKPRATKGGIPEVENPEDGSLEEETTRGGALACRRHQK